MLPERRKLLALMASALAAPHLLAADEKPPVKIAVSAEYGMQGSFAAQSIEKGVALAVAEINQRGGVLGGRRLEVVSRDDRGLPARAIDNMRELARDPDVVAVFCGRFSPVALELVPVSSETQMLLLDPWAAADGIANNGQKPNYVFRLSLIDTWAIEAMLDHARKRRMTKLTALLPNTGWGRSSQAAIERYLKNHRDLRVEATWYNWGDTQFADQMLVARRERSDGILLIANEAEAKHILRVVDGMEPAERLPIIAHWGMTAGDFNRVTEGRASRMDFVTVQTFAFSAQPNARQAAVLLSAERHLGEDVRKIPALVGFAHAYDLTHLLALAIGKAKGTDRKLVRAALEQPVSYDGLVRSYRNPFTATNHEALSRDQVFIARYAVDGSLVPVSGH